MAQPNYENLFRYAGDIFGWRRPHDVRMSGFWGEYKRRKADIEKGSGADEKLLKEIKKELAKVGKHDIGSNRVHNEQATVLVGSVPR